MNDLKFAFRQLLKHPGFTAVAALTLALGISEQQAVGKRVRLDEPQSALMEIIGIALPSRLLHCSLVTCRRGVRRKWIQWRRSGANDE